MFGVKLRVTLVLYALSLLFLMMILAAILSVFPLTSILEADKTSQDTGKPRCDTWISPPEGSDAPVYHCSDVETIALLRGHLSTSTNWPTTFFYLLKPQPKLSFCTDRKNKITLICSMEWSSPFTHIVWRKTYCFTLVSAVTDRSAMHFSSFPHSTKGIYKIREADFQHDRTNNSNIFKLMV